MQTALEKFHAIHLAMKLRVFGAPRASFPDLPSGVFDERLMCFVYGISYDHLQKTGHLRMDRGNCAHMPACIEIFEKIDPSVTVIHTWADGVRDTRYRRLKGGKWIAELDEG